MGIPHSLFEEKLEGLKVAKGVTLDTDLTASDLKELVAQYKTVYYEAKGEQFPSGINTFLTILPLEHTIQEQKEKKAKKRVTTLDAWFY